MINQWRAERAKIDRQMDTIRQYIDKHPNRTRYQESRSKLFWMLNQMALARQALTAKIVEHEKEERLMEVFKDLSKKSDQESRELMETMARLLNINVS